MGKELKGVWMPIEILREKNLTMLQKLILSMIINLDNENGCHATNQFFSDVCGCSVVQVSTIISYFEYLVFFNIENGKNAKRVITFKKLNDYTIETFKKPYSKPSRTLNDTFKKLKADNIYIIYNIIYNLYKSKKEKIKKEKKKKETENNKEIKPYRDWYAYIANKEMEMFKLTEKYNVGINVITEALFQFCYKKNSDKQGNFQQFKNHFTNYLNTDIGRKHLYEIKMAI